MNVHVKICGITNIEDALVCAGAGAEALGFIFYRKSPRYISPSNAAAIIRELPSFVTPVGVFVNEKRSTIENIISSTGIRVIQLSGDESPEECAGYSVKVWKALRLRQNDDVGFVKSYAVNAIMLDGAPAGQYGGSGVLPDYSVALQLKRFHPLILAGGLKPDNLAEAISAVRPYAVDVNSGVEASPGRKDHHQIQQLFENLALLNNEST